MALNDRYENATNITDHVNLKAHHRGLDDAQVKKGVE